MSRVITDDDYNNAIVILLQMFEDDVIDVVEVSNLSENSYYDVSDSVIKMGSYSDIEFKIAILFHEFGHVGNGDVYISNQLLDETMAWLTGMGLFEEVFGEGFNDRQLSYMVECIGTYS